MNSYKSVKGPKDPNSATKCWKVTSIFKMSQKITPKREKLCHNSLLQQNSVKFGLNFTQDKKHFTWTLFTHSYVFASLKCRENTGCGILSVYHTSNQALLKTLVMLNSGLRPTFNITQCSQLCLFWGIWHWYSAVLHSAVMYISVLCSAVLYSAVQTSALYKWNA